MKRHSKRKSHQAGSAKMLKSVGKQIKAIRRRQNKSISDVAKKIRVSSARLEKIEEGLINYNLRLLYQICDLYGVQVLHLFPREANSD
jgi:transcriptional regulator with XRE-family HTH domain